MSRVAHSVLILFLALLPGCGFSLSGVEVKAIHSSVQKPSNVAMYVAIKDGKTPVTELDESNFLVFEDEKLLDKSQTRLTLLPEDAAVVRHVLLLLDLSSAPDPTLESAVEGFVQAITKSQSVSVFGFDGGNELRKLGEFQVGHSGEVRLSGLTPGNPSRNLNGAVLLALKRLNAQLMRIKLPVHVGTLVVFARGPDMAARETSDTVYTALDSSTYDAFAVGVKSAEAYYLDDVGPSGKVEAESAAALGPAFQEVARMVNDTQASHYLLQYCSPARAGTPIVRLEVRYVNTAGENRSGDLELGFDASGFGPGCDPRSPPTFQKAAKDPWNMDIAPVGSNPAPAGKPPAGTTSAPSNPPPAPPMSPTGPAPAEDDEDTIVPPPDGSGYE